MPMYLAVTLGPIYQTLIRQRKTRSVFAASYLFSYTMRKLIEELLHLKKGFREQILTPSPNFLNEEDFIHPGCGLYSDRLIMWSEDETDGGLLEQARNTVLQGLLTEFQKAPAHMGGNMEIDYLAAYVKIYGLNMILDQNADTIKNLNRQLDYLELFENYPFGEDDDKLLSFFNQVWGHFLLEDAMGPGNKKKRFDTLTEIATRGLSRIPGKETAYREIVKREIEGRMPRDGEEAEEDDDSFYEALEELYPDDLQPYHKYVAVVNVDGDNFSKHIGNMEADAPKFKAFSDAIFRFGREAKDEIKRFGGAPVYIGGDDLLFFAPVVSRFGGQEEQTQTVFDLVERIDKLFYQHFPPARQGGEYSPTMSYGISFSYYKYPLNEALAESFQLLDQAKDKKAHPHKRKHPNKNAIAFRVLKHSGHYFDAIIDKDHPADYPEVPKVPNTVYQWLGRLLERRRKDKNFINSITYGMAYFQDLLGALLLESNPPQVQAVQNLFDNHLNESIHDQHRAYINEVVQFVLAVFARIRHLNQSQPGTFKDIDAASEEALRTIYSVLRFIDFVRSSTH